MARTWLLQQNNSDLRRHGIYTWTLPAWVVTLPSGDSMNVCPSAGVCAQLCFARQGSYRYPNVRAAHMRNLLLTLDDSLPRFEELMSEEVQHRRYRNRAVRLHDAGDFHSRAYLETWLRIIRNAPEDTFFYCYTKEVRLFQDVVVGNTPANFDWLPSLGGREDYAVDLSARHADVFPDEEALTAAGYSDQSECDLLAVRGPERVGMPANNIPRLRKMQGQASFGQLQRARDERLNSKRASHPAPQPADTILR
ncbi:MULTISPECIES: GP88 family protein [unclassified Streptomyces]|uniref:GP88 family protein n=1 Tax=unclassified Streptomyces TaxID=2593676 RepID=UPI002E2ABE56|nr:MULTISPECIES: hypothetical protein [unclassified Streptomyces]